MVDFLDNPIIELFDFILNNAIGAYGPLGINRVMNVITGM
jgi:hypothetical protein